MDLSKRNRKVAISRWKNELGKQRAKIENTTDALILKALICGFLAGDGSVQVRREKTFFCYQLDFFPDDKLMLETYINAIKRVYKKEPSIRIRDNVYNVRLTSKIVVQDLLKLANFGLKTWNTPTTLFYINKAKESWLRAFFSAEAYVSPKSIKIQTVNCKGMSQVSKLLSGMGIENKLYRYNPKKKNYSKVCIIFITKKLARRVFYEKIGFWHNKKTEALKKALAL